MGDPVMGNTAPMDSRATRASKEWVQDILNAIARARIADKRMRLAKSLADDAGFGIAYEAILLNRIVIAEAVRQLPTQVRDQAPAIPWDELAALRDVISHPDQRVIPETVNRPFEEDLGATESALRRLMMTL